MTKDCKFLGQSKCSICNRFSDMSDECYLRKAKDLKHKGEKSDKKGKKKKQKRKEMSQGEEVEEDEEDEHIVFSAHEPLEIIFDDSEKGLFFNFDEHNVNNYSELDPPLLYYDWLCDSAMTSHVSNRHEAFKIFHLLTGTQVSGVGNVKAKAKGQGTVELMSSYDGHNYILKLENVLYIPTNCNNLISFGRWDKAGGHYTGGALKKMGYW